MLPTETSEWPLAYQVACAALADALWVRSGCPDMEEAPKMARFLRPSIREVRMHANEGRTPAQIVAMMGAGESVPDRYADILAGKSASTPTATRDTTRTESQAKGATKNLFSGG